MKVGDFAVLSCGVLLGAIAQIGLKYAVSSRGPIFLSDTDLASRAVGLLLTPALWCALFAFALSVAIWLVGLSRVPVTQAYPLVSMGYVFNIGVAWCALGEVPTIQRILGIVMIVFGVAVVALS